MQSINKSQWITRAEVARRYKLSLSEATNILSMARSSRAVHFMQTKKSLNPKCNQYVYLQEDLDRFMTNLDDAEQARWMRRDAQEKHALIYGNETQERHNNQYHTMLFLAGASAGLIVVGILSMIFHCFL